MLKLFILYLTISTYFLTAKTLEIGGEPLYTTKSYLQYAIADEERDKIDNVGKKQWEESKESICHPKNFNYPYWVKLVLKNSTSQRVDYFIKAENQFTYHIEFYLLKNGKVISSIEDGVISKNHNRAFNANHMIFPVTLEAHEEAEVYFKIQNYNKINLNFLLTTREYLLDYYQTYNFLEGIFFGGMILMILYNLFLYALLRIRAYLYYVLYTFWLLVYFIGLFGFSERYFSNFQWIFYISSGAFFISLTLFIQSILNLKVKLPKINKLLNIFLIYIAIATLINIYVLQIENFIYSQLMFNLFFILVPILIVIMILSTYYLWYFKDDSVAKVYSVIWTIIAIIGMPIPLIYLNILTVDIHPNYIFQFFILLEILAFSFVLALKLRLIEKEKKRQEKILLQQNKLASMGEMLSAIAHQWRQPLSEINGIILNMDIDYKRNKLNPNQFTQHLDELELKTSYMSNTIHDFMDFFKQHKRAEYFLSSELIYNAIHLIQNSTINQIDIQYINHEAIKIQTYKSELTQALIIVLNNAIDACFVSGRDQHKIVIKDERDREYLIIKILDTGRGISPEILDKIFTPYFTTKHKSKGTGLGLYILQLIIEQNMQGRITVQSSDLGTEFKLKIPLKCVK